MPKITIIGAGGFVFPLRMVRDLLSFPALQDSTICLFDIDGDRNARTANTASQLIEQFELPTRLDATTDRDKALTGADFCICTFQVGGIEAYGYDVEIPREYGIDQCVGDSFGPGGIFRGLRSIEALRVIAEDMQRLCPDALFIQYANPMAINCWAMSRLGIANVGLCHSVQGTSRMLAEELDLPYEECSFTCAGLNHQAWFIDFRHLGRDVMPLLRERMYRRHVTAAPPAASIVGADSLHAHRFEKVRSEIMRLTGYFHTESSAHASEYLAYFRRTPEMVGEYQPRRWDYYEICKAHDLEAHSEEALTEARSAGLVPSNEWGAFIVDSMVTGTIRMVHGSVANAGVIANLSPSCAVEVPITVDRQGLRPQIIGELPAACAAVSRLLANQVELTVEAALTGDRDMIYAAVALDPLTGAMLTLPQIRQMVDRMLECNAQWLPEYRSRTFVRSEIATEQTAATENDRV